MDITTKLDAVLAKHEEGHTVTIYDENDAPYLAADGSPCTVTVIGVESKRCQQATDAALRKMGSLSKEGAPAKIRLERAVAAVIGWHGWELGDQPAPFAPDNMRKLCRALHILAQIEAARDSHASFFANSSAS